jgi:hypothetical protein
MLCLCFAFRLARIHKRREERSQRMALRPHAPRQKVRPAFANDIPSPRELCGALPTYLMLRPTCHASPCRHALSCTMNSRPRWLSTCRSRTCARQFLPSRVEAQACAEPSGYRVRVSQGPVLNQEATRAGCHDARPPGLTECERRDSGWRKARPDDDVDSEGAARSCSRRGAARTLR